MLKTEIDKKVNELSKVHLKELLELQTEVDKEYFLNPETKGNGNLSVEDCCICKKLFYSEEELKKHEDERTRMCVTCGRCMTPDSEEYKYCVAMEHLE